MRRDGGDRGGNAGDDDLTGSQDQRELSASDQSVAGNVTDIDATLRIANRVKRDFDRIGAIRAGDEALIARLADRALASRAPVPRRRADRRVAAMLGLGLVLFASAAGAWWAVRAVTRSSEVQSPRDRAPERRARVAWRGPTPHGAPPLSATSPSSAAPAPSFVPPPRPASPGFANRVLAPVPAAGGTRPVAAAGPVHSLSTPRSQDRGPALAPPPAAGSDQVPPPSAAVGGAAETPIAAPMLRAAPPAESTIAAGPATAPPAWSPPMAATAADLFQRANSARRAGDVGTARALYREVEDRFPGSAEARLARVSLGKLLLAAGDARGAEQEFAHYLAGGGGPLVQEALVGRAESLQSLARPDEERRVWQRIVDEFPSGVYAAQARRRLADPGARPRLQAR